MLVRRFHVAQFASIAVSHSFVLRTPHWSLASSNFLFFFLPFPLSFWLYPCLAPSHSWWVWALLSCRSSCWLLSSCRLWLHHDEFGDRFFSYCRCVTTVSYARTVRAARYGSFRAPAVHYRLYHAGTTIRRCPAKWRVSHLFVLRSPCFSFWLWLTLLLPRFFLLSCFIRRMQFILILLCSLQ